MNKIILGDCLEVMKDIPDKSIDMVLTSPPYWALRDYGVDGQLGQEKTFQEYITKLCDIFDECKRILKDGGTCWANIGDTYGGTGDKKDRKDPKYKEGRNGQIKAINKSATAKSLCQIPSRFAIEMTNRGWILRNEIIWHKPNAMPSPVKDRFTVDFEKVFFFTKSKKYFFEQQFDEYAKPMNRWGGEELKADGKSEWDNGTGQDTYRTRNFRPYEKGKNKRTVWSINTKPSKEPHFASYPEALIDPMIKAGCPVGGVVLDPFFGIGTTGIVAKKNNRNYIGIEISPEYIEIIKKRLYE
jgi:site-specific DNA-methyltransferase (adenine-specific)